jgi:hypothetical protein
MLPFLVKIWGRENSKSFDVTHQTLGRITCVRGGLHGLFRGNGHSLIEE